MELDAVLPILQQRPFDRTRQNVQQLAHFLASNKFFGGMQPDVVQLLCTTFGHASVEETAHVFKQGQIGDCMYIVLKGYCSVLKHPQPDCSSSHSNDRSARPESQNTHNSTGSSSQPVSRRVTLEQQTQQFALATAAVGTTAAAAGSRRGTLEGLQLQQQHLQQCTPAVAAAAAAVVQQAGSRRVTGGQAGSRRSNGEYAVQQQEAEPVHVGWVGEGESFGEAALLNPKQPRQVSVVAGDGGVLLAVLDRAAYNRLQLQAQSHQAVAAAALQSVLAAACRPLLQSPPGKRTAEEVSTLAELMSGLEAFRSLPEPVRARLARSCQAVGLPDGALVFEEDQKGDAMYVVMAGSCQVRARPLKPAAEAAAAALLVDLQPGRQPGQPSDSVDGGATAGRRSTVELGSVGCSSGGDGGSGGVGGRAGVLAGVGSTSAVRRTTWEGVAFTCQEQAKLEAVKAALEADKHQKDAQEQPSSSRLASQHDKPVERDGLYWTAKYMSDAVSSATAADPHWGLEGGMTPLAAVFAAKWRQQMRKQQADKQAQQQHEDESAEADRAYAAMEELLGKAAAKAWRAARDSLLNTSTASPAEPSGAQKQGGARSSKQLAVASPATVTETTPAANSQLGKVSSFSHSSSSNSGRVAGYASSAIGGGSSAAEHEGGLQANSSAAVGAGSNGGSAAESSAGTPRASGSAAASAASAAAAAYSLLSAAAQAANPADALKLQLAALGVKDPADVSRALLEEVGARAGLEGLLTSVAALLERRGLPRRLSRKGSMKITKELNKRMLGGASWKGYGGNSGNGTGSSNTQQEHPQQAAANGEAAAAAARKVGFAVHGRRVSGGGDDDCNTELATEATDMSCDWRSSLDGSETASLCMSIDAESSACYGRSEAVSASNEGGLVCSSMAEFPVGGTGGGWPNQSSAGVAAFQMSAGSPGLTPKPQQLKPEEYDELYGPVIRTLGPGDSFGELALLQRAATRTATVMVTPTFVGQAAEECTAAGDEVLKVKPLAVGGALLIRITRNTYDATVRSLQVAALEDLLGFLSGLAPFKCLSRELLTSLAVFIRPVTLGQGQLAAVAGDKVNALIIIQEGEMKLLDTPAGALTAHHALLGAAGGGTAVPVLPRSRRATADETLLRANQQGDGRTGRSLHGSPAQPDPAAGAADASTASAVTSRVLIRQLSHPVEEVWRAGSSSIAAVPEKRVAGAAPAVNAAAVLLPAAGAMSALSLGRVQQASAQLAVLGPGSLLGENVLGYNAEQDPLAAVAAAKTHKSKQAALTAAAALTHHATAVAVRPCRVLVLSAADLRRFGRRVRGPLAALAVDRRDFLQQRRAAVQGTKSTLAQLMADMRQQLDTGAAAAARTAGDVQGSSGSAAAAIAAMRPPTGRPSIGNGPHSVPRMPNIFSKSTVSSGRSSLGPLAGFGHNSSSSSGGGGSSANVSISSSGTIPSAAMMRRSGSGSGSGSSTNHAHEHGSGNGAGVSSMRPSASQWQQQQWQQQAFGELLHPQPALQELTVADVTRLKQLVPSDQAPCVSELAAAARAFPVGALTATAAVAGEERSELCCRRSSAAGVVAGEHEHSLSGLQSSNGAISVSSTGCSTSSTKGWAGSATAGLKALLVPQHHDVLQQTLETVGSPCWIVGPGGRISTSGPETAAGWACGRCQGPSAVAAAGSHEWSSSDGCGSCGGHCSGSCSSVVGRQLASQCFDGLPLHPVVGEEPTHLPPMAHCGRRAPLGRELSANSSASGI